MGIVVAVGGGIVGVDIGIVALIAGDVLVGIDEMDSSFDGFAVEIEFGVQEDSSS
jgi:hypothetical protein